MRCTTELTDVRLVARWVSTVLVVKINAVPSHLGPVATTNLGESATTPSGPSDSAGAAAAAAAATAAAVAAAATALDCTPSTEAIVIRVAGGDVPVGRKPRIRLDIKYVPRHWGGRQARVRDSYPSVVRDRIR